ncbi:MAG: ketopantoate reductase family protein [Alphaproteobacteria bacterium]
MNDNSKKDVIVNENDDDDDALVLTEEVAEDSDNIKNINEDSKQNKESDEELAAKDQHQPGSFIKNIFGKNSSEKDNYTEKKPQEIIPRSKFYSLNQEQKQALGSPLAIVGTGTLGSLFAGLFLRSEQNVVCFSSPNSIKRIALEGITINSKIYDDFSFRPDTAYLIKQKPEFILVTARSTHIDIAMTAIYPKRVQNTPIIVITSGFDFLKNLQKDYGASVSIGFVEPVWAYREDVNRTIHLDKKLTLTVANSKTIEREKLEKLIDRFKLAGIDLKIMDSETDLLWLKNISFAAISLISGAAKEAFKTAIKDKRWFELMEKIIWEALVVAKKDGSKATYDDIMKIINDVPNDYKPPLLIDLEHGQIGEIDDIANSIIRLGQRYELDCPIIKKFVSGIIKNASRYYEVRVSPYL